MQQLKSTYAPSNSPILGIFEGITTEEGTWQRDSFEKLNAVQCLPSGPV